jgi:prolyl-tRNA synthetase
LLTEIQDGLFQKALKYRDSMIHQVENYEEFKDVLENKGLLFREVADLF